MCSVLNGIFYVLLEGLRWRSLPGDFPGWQTVYTQHGLGLRSNISLESLVISSTGDVNDDINLVGLASGILTPLVTHSYILSKTGIPSKSNPNFKVLAVKSHKINRDVRSGSSASSTRTPWLRS